MSSGALANMPTISSTTSSPKRGALGPRDGQAFGQVAARQRGDVVAAEHARPASGQHHQPGQRVDQQLAPRRGDEVGVEFDRQPAPRSSSASLCAPARLGQHQPDTGAQPDPAVGLRSPRRTTRSPGHHCRRRAQRPHPFDLLDAVLQCADHRVVVAEAAPASRRCALVLGVLDGQQHDVDGAVDVARGRCARARAPRWRPRRRADLDAGRAACDRTAAPDGRQRAAARRLSYRWRRGRRARWRYPQGQATGGFAASTLWQSSVRPSQGEFSCCAAMPPVRYVPPMPVSR